MCGLPRCADAAGEKVLRAAFLEIRSMSTAFTVSMTTELTSKAGATSMYTAATTPRDLSQTWSVAQGAYRGLDVPVGIIC